MSDIDILWILLSAFLVFLMQFGFALIETGVVRSKNTINVAMKNLIDLVFSVIFFWAIGYGLMYGEGEHPFWGVTKFFIDGSDMEENAFFIFQAMFAATAITVVSGSVAERIKFNAYVIVAIIVTALIYPLFGHWVWSDQGWLKELGFVDFAGSTVVHSVGAWIGLAGAIILGPRMGKFRHGSINYFAPSNHNFIVFGVIILLFAWFGFNGGSLLRFDVQVTSILLNTIIAAMFGGLGGWFVSLISKKKVSIEFFSFGILAGLVGITAGCEVINVRMSALVGFSSAIIMVIGDYILVHKLKIDDPLSAVSVHGFVGAWGTLCVGLFGALPDAMTRFEFISIQLLGIGVGFLFAFSCGLIMFYLLHSFSLLRVSKKNEFLGLNVSEHNAKLPWVETVESIIRIMKTGNIHTKIYEERATEVGIVAKFFNYLLDILREKQITLVKSNQILKTKAEIDPLTKLYNRRTAMENIKILKTYNIKLGIIVIDIDHFKSVNDTYGHSTGDIVLKELAQILLKGIRKDDMAVRWGGEEFLLLTQSSSLIEVETIAEKLRVHIEKHTFPKVNKITASLGVSFGESDESFEELFEKADQALYQAKELGRNRVCTW